MIEPTANLGMSEAQDESWKNEIASRLDTYRSKNKRKLSGDFSMRFNFDGELAGPRQQICVPALPELEDDPETPDPGEASGESLIEVRAETCLEGAEHQEEPVPGQVELPQTVPPAQFAPLRPSVPFKRKIFMEANVIEFPRLFPPEPTPPYVLAEPVVHSSPRILDAPEIAEPLLETPILDGMRLEHLEEEPAPALELPLQVAPVRQRIYSSIADCLIVLIASGVFYTIAYKLLTGMEWTKPVLGAGVVVPAIFWAVYQYLFIVYGARTPGMAMTQLAFSTFQGTAPSRRQRRLRVVGLGLSCSSLMLGFLWAFFDEDMLCWHDRISRTYTFRQRA